MEILNLIDYDIYQKVISLESYKQLIKISTQNFATNADVNVCSNTSKSFAFPSFTRWVVDWYFASSVMRMVLRSETSNSKALTIVKVRGWN